MSQGKQYEPDMLRINDIEVVEPTARIPLGQYVKMSEGFGIQFPSVPFGKRGMALRNAMQDMLKALSSMEADADDDDITSEKLQAMSAEQREQAISQMTDKLTHVYDAASEKVEDFYRVGLSFNYHEDAIDWIMNNLPITQATLKKLILAVQGDDVDSDSFRRQPSQEVDRRGNVSASENYAR